MSFDLELINGDLSVKADGAIRTVTDSPKLRQDILKIILTSLGSNKFHPWYGCVVTEATIGSNYSDSLMFANLKTEVTQTLERLKTLQLSQASDQNVSLAEMIADIGGVQVERDAADPRQVNVVVTVLTRRLTLIEEVFTITS